MRRLRPPSVLAFGMLPRLGRYALGAGLLGGVAAAACGGRSTLYGAEEESAGVANPEPSFPSRPDPPTTPPVPPVTPGPEPEPEPEPEPQVPCEAGRCADDGDACNGVERCDPDTNLCVRSDAPSCDDGVSCNGVETCDPALGCVSGEPVVCEAPGAYCDENLGRCVCDEPFLAPDCKVMTAFFAHFGQVRELAEEPGVLWVTTTTGLWALDFGDTPGDPADDVWVHFDELTAASETGGIVIDQAGSKWFSGSFDRQLVRLEDNGTPLDQTDDAWYFYRFGDTFSPSGVGVDNAGGVWLGRAGETLIFSDAQSPGERLDDVWRGVSELGAPDQLVLASVDTLLSEPLGVVWLGSSTGGLFAHDAFTGQFAELTHQSWPQVHGLSWASDSLWLSVSSDAAPAAPEALASVPVRDSVFSITEQDWQLHALAQPITRFDVDAGGRVWTSHPTSGLSCLDVQSAAWSAWTVEASIQSILARSAEDLWFGGESVAYLDHGGSCSPREDAIRELVAEQALRSPARDVAIEGNGIWLATDGGVDYVDIGQNPYDPADDRWAHFDTADVPGLEGLQGVLVGFDGIKYFWGDQRVFAFDDGASPWDRSDHAWVAHDTELPLWVSGVLDQEGRLLVVARTDLSNAGTARVEVFDPGPTPGDSSDDVVVTIDSGLPGLGRNMTIDSEGQVWLATEAQQALGNLFHWDRQETPVDGSDDVWTKMRDQEGRVWKLEADPTGGVWGRVAEGVFHFYDAGTPTDLSDDYWHIYPELGSAMDIGPDGNGWFRMPGGAGILDVGGTPRDPGDDVARVLLSPEALRFQSDLWTNGTIDDQGRFWVVDEYVQVFEVVE